MEANPNENVHLYKWLVSFNPDKTYIMFILKSTTNSAPVFLFWGNIGMP